MTKNYYDPKKQANYLIAQSNHLLTGQTVVNYNVLEQREIIDVSLNRLSSHCYPPKNNLLLSQNLKEISVTAEYPLLHKKKTWKDKFSSSELTTLNTKLLKILDLESTLKEKVLIPFWTPQSKVISEQLWLPTKIDCVDSVLNSSKESLNNNLMGKSWFSIKKKHPLKMNSLMTSFQLSQFSLPDSMDCEVIQSKNKSKNKLQKQYKTLKFRIFPTDSEKEQLQILFDQSRWYYNASIDIFYNHYNSKNILEKNKYSNYTFRDIMRKYRYVEDTIDNFIIKEFVYDETANQIPVPEWWKDNIHSRTPRGATEKFISSINSAISNYKNGNIKKFDMKYRTKKDDTDYVHYEDIGYPTFIRKIKSRYWYTTKDRKRKEISFSDIKKEKGLEIIYEKKTGRYFLHYPVDINWYPEDDRRNDSQVKYEIPREKRIISLDPGIRKFLVGYDPKGYSIVIGEGENKKIVELLHYVDTAPKNQKYKIWKKIKNMINELHWKTITFLLENYDIIILPEFKTGEMVRKKKLSRETKRMMLMYSFYKFKEKLKWKSKIYKKEVIIVDESYTSCTCTSCGVINRLKGEEKYKCKSCKLEIDRDVGGSRNILIKNLKYNL